jgi:hypothetical protein
MFTLRACRISLFALAVISTSALATGPGILVGSEFEEHFTDGFDDPAAVTFSANLTFEPGRVVFGDGGLLHYEFKYEPVDGPYGPVEPNMGTFWVEFWDDLDPAHVLEISASSTAGTGPFGTETNIRFSVGVDQIVVSSITPETGPAEVAIDRVEGLTRVGFPNNDWYWSCTVENEDGYHELSVGALAFQPDQLRIAGQGAAVESVVMAADAYVNNSADSFGKLKARY